MSAHATPHSRLISRLLAAVGFAVAAVVLWAPNASAASSSLYTEGLHISTGALEDPRGRTWVSDHNAGFCRVTEPTDDAPGTIEHPLDADDDAKPTCLGGLLPGAGIGPDAAGQPAFVDPSPEFPDSGDEIALIPDGASASSDVVRAQWNPDSGLFEFKDVVTTIGARTRPVAASLGPDDNVYVTFQRSSTVQRITDPAGSAADAEILAQTSDGRGAPAVAAGYDEFGALTVYLAESEGITELKPGGVPTPSNFSVPLVGGEAVVSTLIYDLERRFLYAGTSAGVDATDAGIDAVHRFHTDLGGTLTESPHAEGFSMIGGFGLRPNGRLLVADDPALLDLAEPLGMGRLFQIGLPVANVTAGPARYTNDTEPTFEVSGDGTLECALRLAGESADWDDCPDNGVFAPGSPLSEGTWVFSVRADDGTQRGIATSHRFTVDTTPPAAPSTVRPAEGAIVGASPYFEFASEPGASYECKLDGATEFEPCATGRAFPNLADGVHTLDLRATDRAGNVSPESGLRSFTVDTTLEDGGPPLAGPSPTHDGRSLYAGGLHIATGAIEDPRGRIWVADHNAGFCRVTEPTDDGPGTIEHPVLEGDTATPTCLGGLLPGAGTGPDAAGQPAIVDPTPERSGNGDEIVLIPDGASHSSEVVRAQWNPGTELFEFKDTVTLLFDGDEDRLRPTVASLGPDGNVYFVFQRSGTIQRITNPAGDEPEVQLVGRTSDNEGAASIAAGYARTGDATRLYIAEDAGMFELTPRVTNPPVSAPSTLGVPGTVSALMYDRERHWLYAGTGDEVVTSAGQDVVHRIDTDQGGTDTRLNLAEDLTMVGGFGLRSGGLLLVLDDPALIDPAEPLGMGRMFQVGLAVAHVTAGPGAHTNDTTPTFQVSGDGALECALRPAGQPAVWAPCPAGGSVTPDAPLAPGDHILSVRAVDGSTTGVAEVSRFTVDTTAPARPTVVRPVQGGSTRARPWFEFSAEPGASFRCRLDGAATFTPCQPGRTFPDLSEGNHSLQIQAVDRAGNVSQASTTRNFSTDASVPTVTIGSGLAGPTSQTSTTFTFSAGEPGVTFGCRLTGEKFRVCAGPQSYSDLADGTYSFDVHARDTAGNVSTVTRRTFTVDTVAPVLTFGASSPGEGAATGTSPTFTWSASESVTAVCRIDGGAFVPCTSPVPLSGLAPGSHTLEVRAADPAGNLATATRTFQVVVPEPPATLGAPQVTAPAPEQPNARQADEPTTLGLTIRVADVARRVDLAEFRQEGVTVTVQPTEGTRLVRFRIFRATRGRGASQAARAGINRRPLVTFYRRVSGQAKRKITLKPPRRVARRLRAGRYVLEVTPGTHKRRLGKPSRSSFVIRARSAR
jgi:Bacterial Ig-like domain